MDAVLAFIPTSAVGGVISWVVRGVLLMSWGWVSDSTRSLCDTYTMNPGSSYLHYNCVGKRASYNIELTIAGQTQSETVLPRFGTAFGDLAPTGGPGADRSSATQASSSRLKPSASTDLRSGTATQAPASGDQSGKSGKKPVGPIVGGVIGGVVFVALVALGVYLLGRRAGARTASKTAPKPQVRYVYLGQPELEGREAREREELIGRQLAAPVYPGAGYGGPSYELAGQPRAYEVDTHQIRG